MNFRSSIFAAPNTEGSRCAPTWLVRASVSMLLAIFFSTTFCEIGSAQFPLIPLPSANETADESDTKPSVPTQANPDRTEPSQDITLRPGNTGVETYWIKDKNGKLIPIVDMQLADWIRLSRIESGLDAAIEPPQYSIEDLSVVGKVTGQRAELDVEIQIKILGDKTVRVPLRLGNAILLERPTFVGEGEHVLKPVDDDGLECWLKGKPNSDHTIKLKLVSSITQAGDESRLNLSLPTANASSLKLTIPAKSISATVSPSSRVIDQVATKDDQTELSIAGAKGEFQLGWTGAAKEQPATESPLLLEAKGEILVSVKGPGAVSTEARITVNSSRRKMESVRIRLPAGSKPVAVEDSRYSTEFVTESGPIGPTDADQAVRPIAIVTFTEPTQEPVEVRLLVEQSATEQGDNSAGELDVLGFEVIDALRHYGTVSILTEGDWVVRTPKASTGLQRLGDIPDAIAQEGLVAAFAYYKQPAALPITVLATETRVNVEPVYVFDVQPDRVELTAFLNCQVLGAPAFSLSIDMTGWEVQEIQQPSLIQEENLRLSEVSPLEIPLANAMRGNFKIVVKAIRKIASDAKELEINMPTVREASVSPAMVVVNPADNLALTPRPNQDAAAFLFNPEKVPDSFYTQRAREPLSYRYRGEPTSASLLYDFGLRKQSTRATVHNEVTVEKNRTTIVQRILYKVFYQPLTEVTLRIPSSLTGNESFKILLDGEVLKRDDAVQQGEDWTFQLLSPRTGDFQIETRYELGWTLREVMSGKQTMPNDESLPNTIQFVKPESVEPEGATMELACPKQYAIELSEYDPWRFERSSILAADLAEYRSQTWPDSASLNVRQLKQQQSQAAMIVRLFAQTWMTEEQRQDRVAALVLGASSPLKIQLPFAASTDNLHVLVNGQPAPPQLESGNRISVDLPDAKNGRVDGESRIELVYQYRRRPETGEMTFELPYFGGAEYVRRFYWQVVLPQNEHLLSHSKTAEHGWQRNGLAWFRKPRLTQSQMEEFAKATTQSAPGATNNHYLFSGFGETPDLEIQTASRRWLLLVSSGGVLAFGILWQILPWIGHRTILVPLALAVCASAWLYPSPAVIVAQAAVLGVGVAMLARVLDWTINRRRNNIPAPPKSDSEAGRSATIIRGSSITQPRSTDALSVPAASQQ